MSERNHLGSPLTVISNRAPYQVKTKLGRISFEKNAGGLVSVLDEVMRQAGGSWIAWGDTPEASSSMGVPADDPRYRLSFIRLSDQEMRLYYQGLSNRVLWPLAHYFLERCHFRSDFWKTYCSVNEKFARVFLETSDSTRVWIHDFHLTLVPELLRRERRDLSIGFFWHIPFPPPSIFRVLPWRAEVVRGLIGSDLVGFQARRDAQNFLDCVEDILGLRVDRQRSLIYAGDRRVKVGVFPVGIDFKKWNGMAAQAEYSGKARQIRREVGAEYFILGADRLDYTKGIIERLHAYEYFLERYPQYRGRVCLVQIAVPSRTRVEEYRILRRAIDEAVGRISGRFSTRQWVPLRYLYKSIPMEELVNYYAAADVALITPLRDGMNLVAEEYVASQIDETGCLILSEFAGAARSLGDALLVNPYNFEEIADTMHLGLSMPRDEKKQRMRRLRQVVKRKNVYWWCESFLQSLAEVA